MSDDPQRLFEGSDASPELRADLGHLRDHDARYDVAAGLARFEASISALPPAPTGADVGGTSTAAATGGSKGLAVVAAIAGVVGTGAVVWALASGSSAPTPEATAPAQKSESSIVEPPTPSVPPTQVAHELVAPEQDEPRPPAPTLDATEAEPGPPPSAQPRRPTNPRQKPAARAKPDADRLAAEMRATKAARAALDTSPARALELTRKADRDFPKGMFEQERRGIEVLALFALGRTEPARTRANAYLRRFPRGAYADRIRGASGQ